MLCIYKHLHYVEFNLDKDEQLLMLMLENVLWKAAYTDLTRYMNTLEWLSTLLKIATRNIVKSMSSDLFGRLGMPYHRGCR